MAEKETLSEIKFNTPWKRVSLFSAKNKIHE